MYDLSDYEVLTELLSRHKFAFKKGFGQNFIVDGELCPRIAESADVDNIGVLEIGPGAGVLTVELAKRAKKVIAIEVDKKLKPVLEDTLADFDNVSVIFTDVLKTDLNAIIEDNFAGMDVCICANLPYYITSPIIMYLLEQNLPVKNITVMVQQEAGERLCAEMGTRNCGAVTAAVRLYAEPQVLFRVDRTSFLPQPNVDSEVIKLTVRDSLENEVCSAGDFFRVVRGAFALRRKTLVNSLSASINMSKKVIVSACEKCGICPDCRAEQLTMKQFIDLCNSLFGE